MYIMIADEADQDGSREFLVYAAVFFPAEHLKKLADGVSELRTKYGYENGDSLKFTSGRIPDGVTRENHLEIKKKIIALAIECGCKTSCYVIPHAIAKGQPHENKLKFGLNTLLTTFEKFLRENGEVAGTAYFDHTTDYKQNEYIKDISRHGVLKEDGGRISLSHIVAMGITQDGMSHLNSVTDIVVGSFRWVINEPNKDVVGAELLRQLSGLLWGKMNDGVLKVQERSLVIRPQKIRSPQIKADVQAFIDRLTTYSTKARD